MVVSSRIPKDLMRIWNSTKKKKGTVRWSEVVIKTRRAGVRMVSREFAVEAYRVTRRPI
jgi:hypothetical protein